MWAICCDECVGKAWVGVRCDVHNSVPPLQEHSANDVVWKSPIFTVCSNMLEHPDYQSAAKHQAV